MRRPHRVPLPAQARELLCALRLISKGDLLFPGVRSQSRPISDGTLNAALRRLGYAKDEATGHGFRATASSLLNESGKWHPDAIERQLAHVESNDARAAYARGGHWDERVLMMQWWADYVDQTQISDSNAIAVSHGDEDCCSRVVRAAPQAPKWGLWRGNADRRRTR